MGRRLSYQITLLASTVLYMQLIFFLIFQIANEFDFDWDQIHNCLNSKESSDLLIKYGDETKSLDPIMTFVPHILINGNHVSHLEFEQSIICSEYCGEKPEVCIEKYSNSINHDSSSPKRIFSSSLSLAIAFLMPMFLSKPQY